MVARAQSRATYSIHMRKEKTSLVTLHPLDTENETFGCRHTNPNICSKNMLPNKCAFASVDKMCRIPPISWKKIYKRATDKLTL